MQMPVFLILFLAPVYVPLGAADGLDPRTSRAINPLTTLLETGRGFVPAEPRRRSSSLRRRARAARSSFAVWAFCGLRRPRPPAPSPGGVSSLGNRTYPARADASTGFVHVRGRTGKLRRLRRGRPRRRPDRRRDRRRRGRRRGVRGRRLLRRIRERLGRRRQCLGDSDDTGGLDHPPAVSAPEVSATASTPAAGASVSVDPAATPARRRLGHPSGDSAARRVVAAAATCYVASAGEHSAARPRSFHSRSLAGPADLLPFARSDSPRAARSAGGDATRRRQRPPQRRRRRGPRP